MDKPDFLLTNPEGQTNGWLYGRMLDCHRGHYISANLVQLMPAWCTYPEDSALADEYCSDFASLSASRDSELADLSERVYEAAMEICERFNEACDAQGIDAHMSFCEGDLMIEPESWWAQSDDD